MAQQKTPAAVRLPIEGELPSLGSANEWLNSQPLTGGKVWDRLKVLPKQLMVKDTTADYSDDEMHAARDVNIPNYVSAIVTTTEIVDWIFFL